MEESVEVDVQVFESMEDYVAMLENEESVELGVLVLAGAAYIFCVPFNAVVPDGFGTHWFLVSTEFIQNLTGI
ncbi:MAG: hypothetical protein HLUCCA01_06235 [Bacteroidetes bacterium HLUCCA01]|nr:MAG: hypothetical protein HLUCCA01_06235 [Bacteroidetes bacterium HLUCCA01]